MMRIERFIWWETRSGNKVPLGDITLTPRSRVLLVRWPGGGWVWNRPRDIVVERNGKIERYPIVDQTRRVQLGLLGLGLGLVILTLAQSKRRRRNRDGR
jgi:hypothetical protein